MTNQSVPPTLPEEDAALLETLTPDLARLLYPDQATEPFRITVVYPELGGDSAKAAGEIEADATAHSVSEAAGGVRLHRTTFSLAQIEEFHALYHLAETSDAREGLELLLNDRRVPLARELWLPLIWTLRK